MKNVHIAKHVFHKCAEKDQNDELSFITLARSQHEN